MVGVPATPLQEVSTLMELTARWDQRDLWSLIITKSIRVLLPIHQANSELERSEGTFELKDLYILSPVYSHAYLLLNYSSQK